MSKFDELFDRTKLGRYRPPPPWLLSESKGTGRSRQVSSTRRKWFGGVEVVMEETKGGTYTIKVYDEHGKLKGRTSGMDLWEAEELFEDISTKLRGF